MRTMAAQGWESRLCSRLFSQPYARRAFARAGGPRAPQSPFPRFSAYCSTDQAVCYQGKRRGLLLPGNRHFSGGDSTRIPFLQRELIGREPPPPRPPIDNRPRVRDLPAEDQPDTAGGAPPERGPGYDDRPLAKPRFRIGWVWLTLSFVFLLLGV